MTFAKQNWSLSYFHYLLPIYFFTTYFLTSPGVCSWFCENCFLSWFTPVAKWTWKKKTKGCLTARRNMSVTNASAAPVQLSSSEKGILDFYGYCIQSRLDLWSSFWANLRVQNNKRRKEKKLWWMLINVKWCVWMATVTFGKLLPEKVQPVCWTFFYVLSF